MDICPFFKYEFFLQMICCLTVYNNKEKEKVKMCTHNCASVINKKLIVVNAQKTQIFEANKSKGFINSFVAVINIEMKLKRSKRRSKKKMREQMSSVIATNK